MNRGIIRTCLFLCLVLAALLALRALPAFTAGGYEIKTVDFLADLLPEDTIRPIDMAPKATAAKVTKRDTCPVGMTCIEDYADSTLRGMAPFYKALASRYSMGRPVRIAYFGDSFIEGDILTADLRALLQRHYGGNGVGFVDIASPFTKLRTSVKHRAIGWTEHNVLEKKGLNMAELGVTCRYARGGNGASVSYSGVNDYNNLRRFDRATLYLSAVAPLTVSAMLNGADTLSLTAQGHGQVEALHVDGPMSEVTFTLGGHATCYGVALEDRQGVILDNFSLRGSSGTPLAAISPAHLHQLSEVRPYDLIVLQCGLKETVEIRLLYSADEKGDCQFQICIPQSRHPCCQHRRPRRPYQRTTMHHAGSKSPHKLSADDGYGRRHCLLEPLRGHGRRRCHAAHGRCQAGRSRT